MTYAWVFIIFNYLYGLKVDLGYDVTDNVAVDTVTVEFDGVNYSMTAVGGDIYSYEFNTSTLVAGIYTYTIYANDTSDKSDASDTSDSSNASDASDASFACSSSK